MLSWPWVILACLSLFVDGLGDNVRGPIYPDLLREFGLSNSLGSMFFLFCSAAAALNNVFCMKWLERIDPYRALLIYTVLQLLGFATLGWAPSYFWVLIGAALMGISMGGLAVAQNTMAAQAAPADKRRQSISLLQCMYGGSSLLAPLLVTLFYQKGVVGGLERAMLWFASLGGDCFQCVPVHAVTPWRWVFIGIAVLTFALLLVAWLLRHTPAPLSIAPLSSVASRHEGESADEPATARFAEAPPLVWSGTTSLSGQPGAPARRRRFVLYYSAVISLYVIAEVGLSTRLVLYVRDLERYNPYRANGLLSLFFTGLFLGRLALAIWKVPLSNRSVLMGSTALSFACFGLGLLLSPLWLGLCGAMMSVYYPCAIALIHEDYQVDRGPAHAQLAAQVTSWCVTSQCLALVVMHFALGAWTDWVGVRAALWEGPVALASLFILLSRHDRVRQRLNQTLGPGVSVAVVA